MENKIFNLTDSAMWKLLESLSDFIVSSRKHLYIRLYSSMRFLQDKENFQNANLN